jgi:hypothetical protein
MVQVQVHPDPQTQLIPAILDRPSVNKQLSRELEAMVEVQATDTDRDYIQTRLYVHSCFSYCAIIKYS